MTGIVDGGVNKLYFQHGIMLGTRASDYSDRAALAFLLMSILNSC